MSWNTSAMPHTMREPVTSAGSPIETGTRTGAAPTAPDSYTSTRCGAWVARAKLQARLGRPIPTNTTSPSASSRAATLAIISSGVYAASEPVIHPGTISRCRVEPCGQAWVLLHVARAVRDPVDELVEVPRDAAGIARDRLPRDVEIVVAIVVPLRVRRVRAHVVAQRPEGEAGRARREARHHAEMRILLDLERRPTLPFHRASERVQRAHAGISGPGENELPGAARGDHLVINQVGREAAQREVAATLADDLVARGEADEMGEPLDDHGVAVVDEAGDGVAHGHHLRDVGHQTSDIRAPGVKI